MKETNFFGNEEFEINKDNINKTIKIASATPVDPTPVPTATPTVKPTATPVPTVTPTPVPTAQFKVEHYFMKRDGTYENPSEAFTEYGEAKVGSTAVVNQLTNIPSEYEFDAEYTANSVNGQSDGKGTKPANMGVVQADGSLVLKLYYREIPRPTVTPTTVPTPVATPTTIPVVTATPTVKPTTTPVPTVKPTATPVPTATPTVKPTATPVPTVKPTATPVVTPVVTPSVTPSTTVTPTPTPTATPVPTATPTPTVKPSENNTIENNTDNSTTNNILPYAGMSNKFIGIGIVVVLLAGITALYKYTKYKSLK